MTIGKACNCDPMEAQFWIDYWESHYSASCIKAAQTMHPEYWERFYDGISNIWDEVTGNSDVFYQATTDMLFRNKIIEKKSKVLDIGCGPGGLAFQLARNGVETTGLDSSAGMINVLKQKCELMRNDRLTAVEADWMDYSADMKNDLVSACFFPQALCPDGINRLESLTSGCCLLIMGDGSETFSLRREIWERLIDRPSPIPAANLCCTLNYLLATGRRPGLEYVSTPVQLSMPEEKVRFFFREYFKIFGLEDEKTRKAIAEVVKRHVFKGLVCVTGVATAAVIWWRPFDV